MLLEYYNHIQLSLKINLIFPRFVTLIISFIYLLIHIMVKRRWKITRIFKFHELHIFGDINLFLRKRENLKLNECVPFEWNLILINIIKNVTDTTFCFIKVKERKKMTSSYSGLFRKHVENVLLVILFKVNKIIINLANYIFG